MKRLMCAAMAGITALTSIVMTVPAAAEEKTNRYGDFVFHAILSDGNSADGTDVCRAFAIRDFAVDITISVHIFEQIGSLSHHIIALGRSNSDPNNHDP